MLTRSGKSGHPCLIPDVRGKVFNSSPLNLALAMLLSCMTFIILNYSAGIPSPPLALFLVMVPKAHLTSHSKMSGSR